MDTISLGIDLEASYDAAKAIGLVEACRLMEGRGGQPVNLDVARRWCNPSRGYRPRGWKGPALLLPVLRLGVGFRTMPEWVRVFEAMRKRMGQRREEPRLERSPRAREAGHRRAEERLARDGI